MRSLERPATIGAVITTLAVLLGSTAVCGQENGREKQAREYVKKSREVLALFKQSDYAAAADICREMALLAPHDPRPPYNLACALARMGKSNEALDALTKALELGFAGARHVRTDPDLSSLRSDPRFEVLAAKAAANELELRARLPYDKGHDIAGLRTIERNPPDGLRYRLRLSPEATQEHPHRLIIWLHPSGGSMNGVVESLAPRLATQGWALMVFTQKQFTGWSQDDGRRLLEHTLPDVAQVPGVDIDKPVLLGYSAGGQMALLLWRNDPGLFGGLVLSAAYPVGGRTATGSLAPLALPESESAKTVPVLTFIGGDDRGAEWWERVQPTWHEAGIPLAVQVVPGKGHTWLLGQSQLETFKTWLRKVKGGEK